MTPLRVLRDGHRRLVALLGVTALVAAPVLLAGPAHGLDRTVTDGPDEPPSVDITSVVYRNHERIAGAEVSVRHLGRTGRLVTAFGPPGSDVAYLAMVRRTSDGDLVTRLSYVTDVSKDRVDCDFNASWSSADDVVGVRVPHTCLRFGRFLEREWIQARMYRGSHSDTAKGVVVGRGDSPGCATVEEMDQVLPGQTRFRVHQRLDTAGRYGDAGAGSYARTYRACDGGARWFVQYSRQDNTVNNKGRVS